MNDYLCIDSRRMSKLLCILLTLCIDLTFGVGDPQHFTYKSEISSLLDWCNSSIVENIWSSSKPAAHSCDINVPYEESQEDLQYDVDFKFDTFLCASIHDASYVICNFTTKSKGVTINTPASIPSASELCKDSGVLLARNSSGSSTTKLLMEIYNKNIRNETKCLSACQKGDKTHPLCQDIFLLNIVLQQYVEPKEVNNNAPIRNLSIQSTDIYRHPSSVIDILKKPLESAVPLHKSSGNTNFQQGFGFSNSSSTNSKPEQPAKGMFNILGDNGGNDHLSSSNHGGKEKIESPDSSVKINQPGDHAEQLGNATSYNLPDHQSNKFTSKGDSVGTLPKDNSVQPQSEALESSHPLKLETKLDSGKQYDTIEEIPNTKHFSVYSDPSSHRTVNGIELTLSSDKNMSYLLDRKDSAGLNPSEAKDLPSLPDQPKKPNIKPVIPKEVTPTAIPMKTKEAQLEDLSLETEVSIPGTLYSENTAQKGSTDEIYPDADRDGGDLREDEDGETAPDEDDSAPSPVEEHLSLPKEKSFSKVNIPSHQVTAEESNAEFIKTEDSHFFAYFMTMIVLCIIGYLVFHNKQKILALALEGRSRRGSRRRPNTSGYRKLDSNLEEAVTSQCSSASVTHVIY